MTGPSPRSPVASATRPKAGRRSRTGFRPRSSSKTGTTIGPPASRPGRRPTRGSSRPATSGWSPSATRTASAAGSTASNPTWSELDRPRSGAGFTTRRSVRQAMASSTAAASPPRTTTTSSMPAAASASRTCWRTGRPPTDASSFPPPKRDPAPAARTSPTVRDSIAASSHRRAGEVPCATSAGDPRSPRAQRETPR